MPARRDMNQHIAERLGQRTGASRIRTGMRRFLVAIALVALCGCTSDSQSEVRQGKKGLHVNCSGLMSSWNKCYKRAEKACNGDYRVLARSSQEGEEAADYPFGLNPAGYTSRSMIIMCR